MQSLYVFFVFFYVRLFGFSLENVTPTLNNKKNNVLSLKLLGKK